MTALYAQTRVITHQVRAKACVASRSPLPRCQPEPLVVADVCASVRADSEHCPNRRASLTCSCTSIFPGYPRVCRTSSRSGCHSGTRTCCNSSGPSRWPACIPGTASRSSGPSRASPAPHRRQHRRRRRRRCRPLSHYRARSPLPLRIQAQTPAAAVVAPSWSERHFVDLDPGACPESS